MPRIGRGWGAVAASAGFISQQHATLPLLFDGRFILWRAGMFLPFAVLLAIALRWPPRLLLYLAIVHACWICRWPSWCYHGRCELERQHFVFSNLGASHATRAVPPAQCRRR
jgi:hypothetical protein